jgi:hypothetical protein
MTTKKQINYNRVIRDNVTGKNMLQINKNKAERLFNQGITVYLIPCKVRVNNIWINLCPINKDNETFNNAINSYSYYNCISELGLYPHYFIELN